METVKTVNGHDIKRIRGARKSYWIDLGKGKQLHFTTVKAAAKWAGEH